MAVFDLEELVDTKTFIPLLKTWFWGRMHELYAVPSVPGHGLLMGCPLWGDEFIDRFLHMSLPTIRAPKNLARLQGNCRMVFYTDHNGFDRLWRLGRDLEKVGIESQVCIIAPEVMAHIPGTQPYQARLEEVAPDERLKIVEHGKLNKYWLLGTVQNLLVQMAARAGMGFHMLMPDHLYAHEYFPNLFRLSEQWEGIAQTSISGDIHACLPELEQWRLADGSLEIPDRELGDLAYRHVHKQTRANFMNGVDITKDLPDSHFMWWQGRDRLYLNCCHMNAAYMSPRVCGMAPVRLHNALDTELPAFMPEHLCVPDIDDGMTFIELSDEKKLHAKQRVAFPEFAARCWMTVHFRDDYMPFFATVNEVPIKEREDYVDEDTVTRHLATLVQALREAKPKVHEALTEARRRHLEAVANRAALREAAD